MKLTNSQLPTINRLILKNVTYQETYQEVYDHVLSALDSRDELVDLEATVLQILQDDFGGFAGVYQIEQSLDKTVSRNILRQYLRHLITFFNWPGMLLTALLAMASYVDIYIKWPNWLAGIFLITAFTLPWCYIAFKNFSNGLRGMGPRKSVFVNKMWEVASLQLKIFFAAKFMLVMLKVDSTYFEHVFFVLMIIHTIVFLKIKGDGFNKHLNAAPAQL